VRAASDEKGYIHSNNENNQNKWCAACGCAESCLGILCTVVPLNGMVCTDTRRSRSRMNMCMRVRFGACLCGIVGTYLCCHGLRCGSSTRRPGHGRPDSRCFSVSPCRRLRRISWKASMRHSGIFPHGLRDWKREGLGGMHALRVRTRTKGGCTCQRKCVERVAPSWRKWPHDECLPNLPDEFQCGNIRWNPQSAVN
jgi:hypothetical protein